MSPRITSRGHHLICLVFLIPLFTGLALASDAEDTAKLEKLRHRIGQLQTDIKQKKDEQQGLSTLLEEAEQSIGKLARSLRVLNGRLSRQQKELLGLRQNKTRQQQELEREQKALAEQVRAAYAIGRQERIKLLLNQQDPEKFSRMLAYYDYLNRARVRRMQDIDHRLTALATLEQDIVREEQKLLKLHEDEVAKKAALERTQVARREVLKGLNLELRSQGKQLEQLKRDEGRLQSLLAGLREALSDIPTGTPAEQAFQRRKGRLPWPSKGLITASFGSSKVGSLVWDGVMISAPEGDDVRAIHHGRVAYADWLRGYGLLIIIDHGDGWMSLYGHNQSLFKETGDWVEVGDPIALVGNSGGQVNTGVYFGIRHQGKPVNPKSWCQKSRGNSVSFRL